MKSTGRYCQLCIALGYHLSVFRLIDNTTSAEVDLFVSCEIKYKGFCLYYFPRVLTASLQAYCIIHFGFWQTSSSNESSPFYRSTAGPCLLVCGCVWGVDASLTAALLSKKKTVAMEEVLRLVSSGDCIKIWDSNSMKVLDQFSPHSSTHPVSQVCWNSNSILKEEKRVPPIVNPLWLWNCNMMPSNQPSKMYFSWDCLSALLVSTVHALIKNIHSLHT